MCNSLQAREIPALDAAKPKPHCNNNNNKKISSSLLCGSTAAGGPSTDCSPARSQRPPLDPTPAPAGPGTVPVTRRIPDRISCKEMKKMSGFPTSLERALVLTSCNLIDGGFVSDELVLIQLLHHFVSDELVLIQLLNLVQSQRLSHFFFFFLARPSTRDFFFHSWTYPAHPTTPFKKYIPTYPAPLPMLGILIFFKTLFLFVIIVIVAMVPLLVTIVDV
jgi:hypothetical protein